MTKHPSPGSRTPVALNPGPLAPEPRTRCGSESLLDGRRPGRVPGLWFILSVLVILAILFGLAWWNTRGPGSDRAAEARMSPGEILGGADTAGYARAVEPSLMTFPRDHGPHPAYRNEWWYLTGNLQTDAGRRFGYQLTIFRNALAPSMGRRTSDWATRQAYMAHFTLTDVEGRQFSAFDRFARGALGLAGAEAEPFRVWLEDWQIASQPDAAESASTGRRERNGPSPLAMDTTALSIFPVRVVARQDDLAIDLELAAGKPLVLNGNEGLSRKGAERGNASYYYSFTRLPTRGTVRTMDGATHGVTGETWLDREWSTSALAPGVDGWDWFSLQFTDSTELMYYRLRRADGSADVFSAGTWVDADGATTPLASTDLAIDVLDHWTSPIDGAIYPSRWRLRSELLHLDIEVSSVLPDQELDLAVRYWEGAVDARGTRDGGPVVARGYVELTGYAGPLRTSYSMPAARPDSR